jgi:hypothetical protein
MLLLVAELVLRHVQESMWIICKIVVNVISSYIIIFMELLFDLYSCFYSLKSFVVTFYILMVFRVHFKVYCKVCPFVINTKNYSWCHPLFLKSFTTRNVGKFFAPSLILMYILHSSIFINTAGSSYCVLGRRLCSVLLLFCWRYSFLECVFHSYCG